jgi:hypothetical protein
VRFLRGFGRFWWDFIVGDDWRIAAGVVVVLTAGALLVANTTVSDTAIAGLTALGIVIVAMTSIVASGRHNA